MTVRSRSELAARFGVPVETLYQWCRQPGFPSSAGFEVNRRQPGRRNELWDERAVGKWIKQHRAQQRETQEREQATRDEARRLRAEGMAVLDIVPIVGLSVSSVRRITEDVPAIPTRALRPHPWHYPDADMLEALKASGATTQYAYGRWRHAQTEPRPSAAAIVKRYGTWKAALAAAQR